MLEEVKQIFNDIRDAIIEMGVDVDYCDSPAEYASKILSITTGGEGSGKTLLFVPVFKTSETKPEKPTGTMSASNPTNYPSGWGTPNGLSTPIWMSYTIVGDSITYVPWTEPVCLSGGTASGDGSDDSMSDLRYRLFTVYGYTATDVDELSAPIGGNWDITNDKLTGLITSTITGGTTVTWSTEYKSNFADSYNTWISSAVFASNGNLCGSWAEPFRISPYTGSGSGSGESGAKGDKGDKGDTGAAGASIFTSFAFTTLSVDQDISNYTVEGGTYTKPVPTTTKDASGNVVDITWTDGPSLTTGTVWMVNTVFSSQNGSAPIKDWSQPKSLADTADIEIIYTAYEPYKNIPEDFKRAANGIDIYESWKTKAEANGWFDDASECKDANLNAAYPVYMAVNKMLHNKWQGWQIMKIKGEKGADGTNGTSINVKGTYDSLDALNAAVENGTITPVAGDAYIIKGELYVWNGDSEGGSFINCGTFHGGSYLYIAFSNNGGKDFTPAINESSGIGTTVGKYIGTCVTDSAVRPETVSAYTWSKWQGTDGFGYEALFKLTKTFEVPGAPSNDDAAKVDNYTEEENGWLDDHTDVTQDQPYCWYCWRKKTPGEDGVAVWGDWHGPHLFIKWSMDGITFSLSDDFVTVYYVDGNNVSGVQTVLLDFRDGKSAVSSVKFEIKEYVGCNSNGVYIEEGTNKLIIKNITSTGYVTINATYGDLVFTKVLHFKRNADTTGYEILLGTDKVFYNTSTNTYTPETVAISVCKDTPTIDGITHEVMSNISDSGLTLFVDGVQYESWSSGETYDFSKQESAHSCELKLYSPYGVYPSGAIISEDELLDDEIIEIVPFKNGDPGIDGDDGDTYIPVSLYKATNSYSIVPAITTAGATKYYPNLEASKRWDNKPEGWDESNTTDTDNPYLWEIVGHFSKKTGDQIGSWYGPFLKTGIPGPTGESGDEKEEVYALSSVAITPTIDETSEDSNNKTNSDDGYLPIFNFNGTQVEAVDKRPSVSSTNPYLYGTYRRKHGGVWSDFFSPYLVANYVSAGLTDEEKEQIKTDVTNSLTSELDNASARVSAVESRLNNIDGTDATFFTDKQEALISAITDYKDDKQNSFADLIINGKESTIKAIAGSETDTKLKDAGVIVDGDDGTVSIFADYKDKTDKIGSSLSSVGIDINAEASTLEQYAVNKTAEKISSVQTQLDAANATWNNRVAKSYYFWAKYKETSNGVKEISEKADYDLSDVGEGKTYATEDAYVTAMTTGENPWTRVTVIDALSQITQEAGAIKIAASEGESWASIVVKANEATGSDITLNADRINFNGETTATQATIKNATIKNAWITEGTISKATITDCTIESQLKSKGYSGAAGSKKGFLFDAAAENGDFAIYALPENGEPTLRLAAATDSNGNTSYDVAIPGAVINNLTSNNITFVDSNGKAAGSVTVGGVEYPDGSFGAMLNLSSPAIQLTSGQIRFATNNTDEPYASFSEAVAKIKANGVVIEAADGTNKGTVQFNDANSNVVGKLEFSADNGLALTSDQITFSRSVTDSEGNVTEEMYASFSDGVSKIISDSLEISGSGVTFKYKNPDTKAETTAGSLTFKDGGLVVDAKNIDFTTNEFIVDATKMQLSGIGTALSLSESIATIMAETFVVNGKEVVFKDTNGEQVGKLTFDTDSLSLSVPELGITSEDIAFKDNNGKAYASFTKAISEIAGTLSAKALQTPVTNDKPSTYITEGICRFIQPGVDNSDIDSGKNTTASYVEIGYDSDSKDMVLKFYSNGTCLYNLGPAGFKKV